MVDVQSCRHDIGEIGPLAPETLIVILGVFRDEQELCRPAQPIDKLVQIARTHDGDGMDHDRVLGSTLRKRGYARPFGLVGRVRIFEYDCDIGVCVVVARIRDRAWVVDHLSCKDRWSASCRISADNGSLTVLFPCSPLASLTA